MDTVMSQKELETMLDTAVREVTAKTTGMRLHQDDASQGSQLCTVHIEFRKGFHSSLTLCADASMFVRMTSNAIHGQRITPQVVEDFVKEYFNVLCGRISAILYRTTKISSRFSVPAFYAGRFEPEGKKQQFVLNYSNEQQEGAQLIHHVPGGDTFS